MCCFFFFFKQKTAYEMRISDWSSDVCSSDLQGTGYVPVTKAGFELTKKSGFYDKNPGTEVAVKQLDATTTENSRGIRLGYLPQIRDIEDAEMEQIFSGKVTPEAGLDNMVKRGNELLVRFEKSVK